MYNPDDRYTSVLGLLTDADLRKTAKRSHKKMRGYMKRGYQSLAWEQAELIEAIHAEFLKRKTSEGGGKCPVTNNQ